MLWSVEKRKQARKSGGGGRGLGDVWGTTGGEGRAESSGENEEGAEGERGGLRGPKMRV